MEIVKKKAKSFCFLEKWGSKRIQNKIKIRTNKKISRICLEGGLYIVHV